MALAWSYITRVPDAHTHRRAADLRQRAHRLREEVEREPDAGRAWHLRDLIRTYERAAD